MKEKIRDFSIVFGTHSGSMKLIFPLQKNMSSKQGPDLLLKVMSSDLLQIYINTMGKQKLAIFPYFSGLWIKLQVLGTRYSHIGWAQILYYHPHFRFQYSHQ